MKYIQIIGIDGVVLMNHTLPPEFEKLEKFEITTGTSIYHPFDRIIIKEGEEIG